MDEKAIKKELTVSLHHPFEQIVNCVKLITQYYLKPLNLTFICTSIFILYLGCFFIWSNQEVPNKSLSKLKKLQDCLFVSNLGKMEDAKMSEFGIFITGASKKGYTYRGKVKKKKATQSYYFRANRVLKKKKKKKTQPLKSYK